MIKIDNGITRGSGDERYLKLDGSNANTTIDIGTQDFTTTGDVDIGALGAGKLFVSDGTRTVSLSDGTYAILTQGDACIQGELTVNTQISTITTVLTFDTVDIDESGNLDTVNWGGATVTATGFTDGVATLTGGNLTDMGNITGTDVDISVGTGTFTTAGNINLTGTNYISFDTIAEKFSAPAAGQLVGESRGRFAFYTDTNNNDASSATEFEILEGGTYGSGTHLLKILKNGRGAYGNATFDPQAIIHIKDPSVSIFRADNTAAPSSSGGAGFLFYANDGSTLIDNGDRLFFLAAGGIRSGTTLNNSVAISGFATEDWAVGAAGAELRLETTLNGTTTRLPKFIVTNDSWFRSNTANYRRYYHLDLASFDPGASGAVWTSAGANTVGGWQLDNSGEVLETKVDVHADWDGVSDVTVELRFQINAASAENNTVDIDIVFRYMGLAEVVTKTQTITGSTNVGLGGIKAQYTMFSMEVVLPYDTGGAVLDVGDCISMEINLNTGASEVDNIILNAVTYHYNTTHVGIESGDT